MKFVFFLFFFLKELLSETKDCQIQSVHLNLGDYYYYETPSANYSMIIFGMQTNVKKII